MRRAVAWTIFVLWLTWGAAVLATPLTLLPSSAARVVYRAGAFICHQRPERSFHAGTIPFPLCARCTGLHLAAPVGLLAVLLWDIRPRSSVREPRPMTSATLASEDPLRPWRVAIVTAAAPTVISVLLEWIGGPTGMVSRCVAAVPLGATAAALIGAALLGLDARERPAERV